MNEMSIKKRVWGFGQWEVFDPRVGKPLLRVPFQWLARYLTQSQWPDRDYARRGDGWTRRR